MIDKYLYRLSLKRGRWAGTQAGRRKFSFERNIWWPAHYLQDDDIGDDKMMRMMTVAKMSPGAPRQTNWSSDFSQFHHQDGSPAFAEQNFFLSFPLHLTQIALKTIKISNITFSDFQHIWYIYHNIFSILVCFSRLSLSLLLSSFQLSTVTFDLGTINLELWTQKYENWFWKEWKNLNREVAICKNWNIIFIL